MLPESGGLRVEVAQQGADAVCIRAFSCIECQGRLAGAPFQEAMRWWSWLLRLLWISGSAATRVRVARRDYISPLGCGLPKRKLSSPQVSNRGIALSRKLPAMVWRFSGLQGYKPVGLSAFTSVRSSAYSTIGLKVCKSLNLQVFKLNSTAKRGVVSNGGGGVVASYQHSDTVGGKQR